MAGKTTKTALIKLVILAFAGSEARMKALWARRVKEPFTIITVEEGYSLLPVLGAIIADSSIDKNFVLVQANCFPVKDMSAAQLRLPVLYHRADGQPVYNSRVPVCLNKAVISDLLSRLEKPEDFDAEAFLKAATAGNQYPLAVGHSFGNYVTQVIKPAPCIHRVLEAVITKHFIATSAVGWDAITGIVDNLLAE